MREIVHLQAGQCGNQIGGKVSSQFCLITRFIPIACEALQSKMATPRCHSLFADGGKLLLWMYGCV